MLRVLEQQEAVAAQVLPRATHDYYAGGTGEELTLEANLAAWRAVRLRPRGLRDVADVSTAATLLGVSLSAPVLVAPTALHGLAAPGAEADTARGIRDAGSLMVLSTRSSLPVERVAEALDGAPWWFQVYAMRDRSLTFELVKRAVAAGATALVLTADTPYVGMKKRPSEGLSIEQLHLANLAAQMAEGRVTPIAAEQDPSVDAAFIAELAETSGLPVLVKGVLRGDDAEEFLAAGAGGIIVSNHGGRQLDRAVATAAALPEVAAAVGGRSPVLVDGGIRTGLDVLVALALGADAVLLGRPVLWALAAGGAEGVRACLDAVRADLAHVLALAGARSVTDLPAGLLAPG